MGADIAIEVDKRVDTDMAIGMLSGGRRYAIEADIYAGERVPRIGNPGL